MSMLEAAIKALGIDPVQLQTAIAQVVTDAAHVKAQVDAAKAGFQQGAQYFNQRIVALETRSKRIEAMLEQLLTPEQLSAVQTVSDPAPLALVNGNAEHGTRSAGSPGT